jgi:hydrogenase/urease accessory protein HupE
MKTTRNAPLLLALTLASTPSTAAAHGMKTAYLEIIEASPGQALLTWKAAPNAATVRPILPPNCRATFDTTTWELRCDTALAGQAITIEGLGPIVSEAVIRVALADGRVASTVVRKDQPTWRIPTAPSALATLSEYFRLGLEHIAGGFDHLLFLAALVLCAANLRTVLLAETAFTLSHTLSFSATALGWIRLSSAATEAAIALSLVLLAHRVITRREETNPTSLALTALIFGAIHGLGFAGGLRELGLPERDVLEALAGFAAGVEVGQVVFLLLAFALITHRRDKLRIPAGVAIGVASTAWLIERTVQVVT